MRKIHPNIAKVPGLAEAVRRHGASEVARQLRIRVQSLYDWTQVPPERCRAISAISGVPLHVIRPDVYPPPGEQAA